MAAIPAAHSCKLGPGALTHPGTRTGCAPHLHLQELQLWPLFLPTWKKQNLPPLFGRQRKKARLKETSHRPGFPLHFPLLEPAEAALGPGPRGELALTAGTRSPEGPRPRAGAPILSAPPAQGGAPAHAPAPPRAESAGPSPCALRRCAAGSGDSAPHPRMPGLRGGPGVTAPHLERPRPHLPHFLVLSHPLLRMLDFGTSCPHSRPSNLTPAPDPRAWQRRLGRLGGCAWAGWPETRPPTPPPYSPAPAGGKGGRGEHLRAHGLPQGAPRPPQGPLPANEGPP